MESTPILDPLARLKVLLESSTPIVVIETVEEVRAVWLVRAACAALNLAVFEWSIASGLVRSGNDAGELLPARPQPVSPHTSAEQALANSKAIYNSQDPAQMLSNLQGISIGAAFILKDLHRHMDQPVVVRRLRDVGQKFSENRRTIVLTSPKVEIPPELRGLVEFLDLPLPDRRRLRQIIDEVVARISHDHTVQCRIDPKGYDVIVESLRGLTEEESERSLSQALVAAYTLSPEIANDVLESKKSLLRRSEMLQFTEASETFSNLGGMENLKGWLALRRGAWEDSARAFGLDPPRGVIILGVQGCGKSLCARAVAGQWNLPLVKFDTAAVYDKFIGETEKRIQKVFATAEGLAPCVLWIDELEKVFAGSGADSASVDAGVSSRLLASFLTWMQDRKAPVFVAATCNNVTALPPELIRKGRFDELFFVDLPNQSERKEIFSIQLARRKRNAGDFDLEQLAASAKGFSGAEIDAAVQTALYTAYSQKNDLSTQLLQNALTQTVPLSITRSEEIERLREWARGRAVAASIAEDRASAAHR